MASRDMMTATSDRSHSVMVATIARGYDGYEWLRRLWVVV